MSSNLGVFNHSGQKENKKKLYSGKKQCKKKLAYKNKAFRKARRGEVMSDYAAVPMTLSAVHVHSDREKGGL